MIQPEISLITYEEMLETKLSRRIRQFNYGFVGEYPEVQRVFLNAKNLEGHVVGGFRAEIFLGWLMVNILFVEESERGKGLGARLLQAGESKGREWGATRVRLDTFGWQAPKFYLKQGYRELHQIPNYFQGFTLHTMCKDL